MSLPSRVSTPHRSSSSRTRAVRRSRPSRPRRPAGTTPATRLSARGAGHAGATARAASVRSLVPPERARVVPQDRRPRSTSGSRGWRLTSGCGPRSLGCAAFGHRHADRAGVASRTRRRLGNASGSPRRLFAWLGLTPSLEQSGQSARQGAITKTGSVYARRLLVESAWHYAREPRIGVTLKSRQHDAAGSRPADRVARAAPPATGSTSACASAASPTTSPPSPSPASSPGFLWAAATAP